MDYTFEVTDKTGRKIHLSQERWRHIQKHPYMNEHIESIKETIKDPLTIRYFDNDESTRYFYKEFKNNNPLERYLLVSVKYLNGDGYIITSFLTFVKCSVLVCIHNSRVVFWVICYLTII